MMSALLLGIAFTFAIGAFTYVFRYAEGPRLWSRLSRTWSHDFLGGIGFEVENDDLHIDDDELVVVYANHQSTAGLSEFNFWATMVLGRTPVWVVKSNLYPFILWPIVRIGIAIVIDRDDPKAAAETIREAIPRIIRNRQILFIFPDSSRWDPTRIDAFREKFAHVPNIGEMTEHVLPPRPNGLFQILDALKGHEYRLIEAANGFSKRLETLSQSLELSGETFHVRAEEIRLSSIPGGKKARIAWLNRRYVGIARWLAEKRNMPYTKGVTQKHRTNAA